MKRLGQQSAEADISRSTIAPTEPVASFARDTFLYGTVIVADRLVGFLLLPLLAGGLGKDDFGVWNQIQTVYGFLSTFLLMGFYHTASSLVAGRGPAEARFIYVGILRLVLLSSAALFVACAAFPEQISTILFAEARYGRVTMVMSAFAISECFYELIVMAFLRAQCEIARCAAFHILKSTARLIIVWLALQAQEPLIIILGALGLTNVAIALYVLRTRILPGGVAAGQYEMSKEYWGGVIRRSIIVAITVVPVWASMASNRFFIVHLLGLESLALYSANYSILSIITFVPMIMTFTLLHHLSRTMQAENMKSSRQLVDKSIAVYLYITLPLLALISLFYLNLVEWLTPGYGVGWVLRVSLQVFFLIFGLEQILVFARFSDSRGQALIARLLALGINLVAGYIIIPHWGIQYAAVPLCLGSALTVVICWITLRNRIGSSHFWAIYTRIAASALAAALAGWMLTTFFSPVGLPQILMTCMALVLLFMGIESIHRRSVTRILANDMKGQIAVLWTLYRRKMSRHL